MATGYLIDTNTVIDFSSNKFTDKSHVFIADIIDGSPKISVINKIELLGFAQVPEQIELFILFQYRQHILKGLYQ